MTRDFQIYVTELGLSVGWKAMHAGGFAITTDSHYAPREAYKAATMEELDAAVERGELVKEFGQWVGCGGILRNWVADKAGAK